MHRKDFIKLSAGALTTFALPTNVESGNKPVMISTWHAGEQVNEVGWKTLSTNGKATDAIEAAGNYMETIIDCCVGLGGYPDRDGIVTLDAGIMEGGGQCGAVAGLERIKHPISVARKLMEETPHVLLVGDGAQKFALQNGFNLESGKLSSESEDAYREWLKKSEYKPRINIENKRANGPFAPIYFDDGRLNHDTMGMIALDSSGKITVGVTTSGMAFKMHGRVGDSPVIGAGLFADDEVGAATSSGLGEEVIRMCGTHLVVEFMRQGSTPQQACKKAVHRIIKNDPVKAKTLQVGFIALDKKGRYGAYAIQKGFVFAVKTATENKVLESKFLIGS